MDRLASAAVAIAHAAHYSGIVVAGVAGFLVGLIWYEIFGGIWRRALEVDAGRYAFWPLVLALFANLVMAAMLQGVLVHSGLWGVKDGMISGTFLWIGFVLTALGLGEAMQKRPASVIAIDTGRWLVVLWVMGAIVGAFGPV